MAGVTTSVRVSFSGDAAQLLAAFDQMSTAAGESAGQISARFDTASAAISDTMAEATKKVEAALAGMASVLDGDADEIKAKFAETSEAITASMTEASAHIGEAFAGAGVAATAGISDLQSKLSKVGEGLGGAGLATGIEDAEKDVETKSEGFSSRIASIFKGIGSSMGNWGIPFAESVTKMGGNIDKAETKGKGFGESLVQVGKAVAVVGTVAFAGVAAESINLANKFQASMELIHTNAGVAQSQIASLSSGVESLAGAVGFSPDELSTGLYHLASNGLKGQESLNALKIAAEGAKNGNADLEDTTNALGAVIAAKMVPGINDYSQAMGEMNAIVGSGDMKMQDLANAMGTGVLASVKGFGVSLTDTGAALATFGDNNIRGAQAGTELRMAVQALAKPAVAGTETLKKLGLSTTALAADMQKGGLKQAINDLTDRMTAAGITGNKVGETLTEAFGKKAGVGINVLSSQLDRFNSKFTEIGAGASKFGSDWTATQQTTKQQMAQLSATVDALGTRFGSWLIPKLEETALAVEKVVTWFTRHKDVAMALAAAIGGALTVVITAFAVNTIGKMVTSIGKAADSVVSLGTKLLGLGGSTSAAAAETEAGTAEIDASLEETAATAEASGAEAGIGMSEMLGPIGLIGIAAFELAENWSSVWGGIESVTGEAGSAIGALGSAGSTAMSGLFSALSSGWNTVSSFFTNIPNQIGSLVSDAGQWLWQTGTDIINGLIQGLVNGAEGIGSEIESIGGDMVSSFASFFGIGSPSKLMAQEIGQYIPAGIAMGALANKSVLTSAVAQLTTGLTAGIHVGGQLSTGITGGAITGSAGIGGVGGAGSGDLTVNVQLGSAQTLASALVPAFRQTQLRQVHRNATGGQLTR